MRQAAAEDARVLPKGIFRFTYARTTTNGISEQYNARGQSESLTAPYQLSLDAKTLANIEPRINQLVSFLNTSWPNLRFNASGISYNPNDPLLADQLSRGQLAIEAEGVRTQNTFALMYGATDRLSFGLIIPRVSTHVRANASIKGRNSAEVARAYFASDQSGAMGALVEHLASLSALQVETFQGLIQERGYDRFEDTEQSGFGDANLGARYNYHNSRKWLHSAQGSITLPTGGLKNPASLTEVDQGTGLVQLGLAHISNFFPVPILKISTGIHYTRAIPGSREKWVPSNDPASIDSILPSKERAENVSYVIGDEASITLGADVDVTSFLNLGLMYEAKWKGADSFAGNFADGDYQKMANDTGTNLRALQFKVGASSVQAFQGKRFPIPLEAGITYYQPLAGRNTPIAPYWTGDVSFFF